MHSRPTLWFHHATFCARETPRSEGREATLEDVNFDVARGELVLVRLDERQPRTPLFDAALGLVDPTEGSVGFRTRRWSERSFREAGLSRSQIGCVFDRAEWVANLELDKNILLSGRHHTDATEEELRAKALEGARHFGLSDLPTERPHAASSSVSRRAALTRAFVGRPELLLLERPTRDADGVLFEQIQRAVAQERQRGVGVVWTTVDDDVLAALAPAADLVLTVDGSRLRPSSPAAVSTP